MGFPWGILVLPELGASLQSRDCYFIQTAKPVTVRRCQTPIRLELRFGITLQSLSCCFRRKGNPEICRVRQRREERKATAMTPHSPTLTPSTLEIAQHDFWTNSMSWWLCFSWKYLIISLYLLLFSVTKLIRENHYIYEMSIIIPTKAWRPVFLAEEGQ